jgi:signal transduction histidine kinase/ActR/RegA family two-component response regulator
LKSIYKFIADTLQKLYPNTIILNISINESAQQSRLETISGLDTNLLAKVIKVSGFNPIGRMYKLTDVHKKYFKSGAFNEFDGGLAEFSASELPTLAATAIKKLVGLHKIYTIGINKDNELLAAIHFLTIKKNVITDGSFIEVFAKQCGLILQKLLFENALTIAKEKAEESDRLKSAFLANMSHEIRTPMNGVLGFTDLLKESNLSGEEQQHYIDIIQKSGNRMLSTINDIIEISRIEAGEMRINAVKVNINKHLFTIKNFFYLEAEKKGINVVIDNNLPNEDLFIVTDKAKLSSILTNLIKNAIKFTKKGEIRIGCKQDNAFLEFYIKDSGIGIPKDRKDAIFNRFEQADIEDKEAHQGSGLGLTISKSYVEMLGGKIWVESEENKGSTFFFTILFDTPKCETESKQTMPIQAKSIVKKLNLLIVEDDSVSSYYLTTILKDKAENIQIAKDGLEAVEVCKNNPKLDLILMDVKLPGIDGLEATRRIRAFNKKVKIIAQTAHAIEGDKEKAIKAGCDDYISKPISKDNLFKHIEKATNTE